MYILFYRCGVALALLNSTGSPDAPAKSNGDNENNEKREGRLPPGRPVSLGVPGPVPPQKLEIRGRKKRPKDMLKRPLCAYNLFFKAERKKLKMELPVDVNIGYGDMARIFSARWKSLSEKEKNKNCIEKRLALTRTS
jgi:hypothetical protein